MLKFRALLFITLTLCTAIATQVQARVFVGVGVAPFYVGPPVFGPPPVYYPPPYYAPPYYAPPYYAPPYYAPPAPGAEFSYVPPQNRPQSLAMPRGYSSAESCIAGPYACPLLRATPPGGACTCPSNNGRRVRGRAN